MFTTLHHIAPVSEAHREALLRDAREYRLATLARAARRGTRVTSGPPDEPVPDTRPATGNDVPERTPAMSR